MRWWDEAEPRAVVGIALNLYQSWKHGIIRNQHRFLSRRGKCLVFIHGEDIGRRSCKRLMTSRSIRHLGMPTAHCKYPCISQALSWPQSSLCSCSWSCLFWANWLRKPPELSALPSRETCLTHSQRAQPQAGTTHWATQKSEQVEWGPRNVLYGKITFPFNLSYFY